MPALIDCFTKICIVARQLLLTPLAPDYLALRHDFIDQLVVEYARLEAVLPSYTKRAAMQLEAADVLEDAAEAEFSAVEGATAE